VSKSRKPSANIVKTPRTSNAMRVIELFAGVGGFRLGLEKHGWTTVLANQWEPATRVQHAFECYRGNFPEGDAVNEDISCLVGKFKSGELQTPTAEMIVGGFPCQDYSVAKTLNHSKGLEGKKGVLWWQIHALVELVKPEFVFLENVDRLLKSPASQKGRDFSIMLRTLGDLGYSVEWRVVNAAEAGFAQRRIRVFIVAKRLDLHPIEPSFDPNAYLSRTGVFARAFPVAEISKLNEVHLDKDPSQLTKSFGVGLKTSPYLSCGIYVDGRAFTGKAVTISPAKQLVLADVLVADDEVPEEYWIPESQVPAWEYLKGAKQIKRTHKASGAEFTYAEGKMSFPDLVENPSRTIITGEGGSSPSRFKHVIKSSRGYRRLTPIELERLNGFPDHWTKYDRSGEQISDVKRAFFMGNALVVGVIERIGEVLASDAVSSKSSQAK
jgi:DNA (cytosine-5)-methyltransferase 1